MTKNEKDLLGWEKVAEFWRSHEEQLLRPRDPLNRRLIELCQIRSKINILDFGTGLGEPGLTAAQLHPDCQVEGVDLSETMIKLAQQRKQSAEIENFNVQSIAGSTLPFRNEFFSAAISSFALEFSSTVEENLREISRVLVPKGRLVISTWLNSTELNPFQCLIPDVLKNYSKAQALHHDVFFRFQNLDWLENLMSTAKFKRIHTESFSGSFHYDSLDDFWRLKKAVSPAVQRDMESLPQNLRIEAEREVETRLRNLNSSNKSGLTLSYCCWIHCFEKWT